MRRLLIATLLVSAAAIGYEILLMRVLSIVQWHHFAYMIISLALLGYGASGTFIALSRSYLEPRFETAFATSALLFSIAMIVCFIVVVDCQRDPGWQVAGSGNPRAAEDSRGSSCSRDRWFRHASGRGARTGDGDGCRACRWPTSRSSSNV